MKVEASESMTRNHKLVLGSEQALGHEFDKAA